MAATREKIFPGDRFIPGLLSVEERKYVRDHIGEKPAVMLENPPPRGVNPATAAIVLERFFAEQDLPVDEIKAAIDKSLALQERKDAEHTLRRKVSYGRFGVGPNRGQRSEETLFAVPLSESEELAADFYSDVTEAQAAEEKKADGGTDTVGGERVVRDPEAEDFRVICGWCEEHPYRGEGNNAIRNTEAHVRAKHPDELKSYKESAVELKRLRDEGDIPGWATVGSDGIEWVRK